jgi:hypothetical protein
METKDEFYVSFKNKHISHKRAHSHVHIPLNSIESFCSWPTHSIAFRRFGILCLSLRIALYIYMLIYFSASENLLGRVYLAHADWGGLAR